ncbi:hypothetical protein ABT336_15565 [Micromonospora sp. NPDC000207]|uniref:hypothetical protein n=1 Tax=Micromonospora sp. NPDC000207 TaxID=3154246 RepID=UPI00331A98C8
MNRLRMFPAVAALSLLTLTACGGEDATPAAATPTTAATSAATPALASPAVDPVSDKEVCEKAQKTSTEMTQAILKAAATEGEASTNATKALLTQMTKDLAETAASGSPDSEAVTALTAVNAEIVKASTAADPLTAMDNPASEKAGKDFNAACKKAGVEVNF